VVFWTSLAVWVVATLGWITLIAGEGALMSLTSCEYPAGDSIYGEASWSWFPPGVRCTWQLELNGRQVEVVESPSVARLGTAAVLVLWGGEHGRSRARGTAPRSTGGCRTAPSALTPRRELAGVVGTSAVGSRGGFSRWVMVSRPVSGVRAGGPESPWGTRDPGLRWLGRSSASPQEAGRRQHPGGGQPPVRSSRRRPSCVVTTAPSASRNRMVPAPVRATTKNWAGPCGSKESSRRSVTASIRLT
jgi:hypothetical protein